MIYTDTRDSSAKVDFRTAVMSGWKRSPMKTIAN